MLEHDPTTRALMAIVGSGTAESADAILKGLHDLDHARYLACQVVHRLVCRPHRNRRYSLMLLTLPKIIRDLVHHLDYGLDSDGLVQLLHGVFKVSPPMGLHLVGLLGLTGPNWVMGIIADNGSDVGYALGMYAAMTNFGELEDDRLENMSNDIANGFMELAAPYADMDWARNAFECARTWGGLEGILAELAAIQELCNRQWKALLAECEERGGRELAGWKGKSEADMAWCSLYHEWATRRMYVAMEAGEAWAPKLVAAVESLVGARADAQKAKSVAKIKAAETAAAKAAASP